MNALVYWLLDADDNVLYVGMTSDIRARLARHSYVQPWWSDVESVGTTDEMSRTAAAELERSHINQFRPIHNRVIPSERPAPGIQSSPTMLLIEHRLNLGPLDAQVRDRRQTGYSWAKIARWMRDETRVEVSPSTVIAWFNAVTYGHPERAAS